MRVTSWLLLLLALVVSAPGPSASGRSSPPASLPVEILSAAGGLPAHIAGRFADIGACTQSASGEYFVFDRRAHSVSAAAPPYDTAREVVTIGAEAGRVLRPNAFGLAADGTFVVADAPGARGRIQRFLASGSRLSGFTLATRDVPTMVFDSFLRSGIASLAYTGTSIVISQPELGALFSEYAMDGGVSRTFGELRPTGYEADRELHLALNTGIPVVDPRGGYYFVFLGGTPMFRKYDARGALLFERHVEGVEVDDYLRTMPNSWPRRRIGDGEVPIVQPGIRAAAADPEGNLWVSLNTPFTYVYDAAGDKRRTVQFKAGGVLSPTSFFFTRNARVLVTPGCYAFSIKE